MEKIFRKLPLYLQLSNLFYEKLANGEWAGGQKLPAVREIAAQYSANPNTVQRAFGLLEQKGYLYTVSTSGRFVTRDTRLLSQLREQMAERKVSDCYGALKALGYDDRGIEMLLKNMFGRDGSAA